jgi:hypothetical protein
LLQQSAATQRAAHVESNSHSESESLENKPISPQGQFHWLKDITYKENTTLSI